MHFLFSIHKHVHFRGCVPELETEVASGKLQLELTGL